ncbi:MAG: hypothetical protein FJ291_14085 [Planctomycetes bacterium]|nr:hypothetical protein [Planctomycetota bacterium]
MDFGGGVRRRGGGAGVPYPGPLRAGEEERDREPAPRGAAGGGVPRGGTRGAVRGRAVPDHPLRGPRLRAYRA